jgi:hypothetical protein
MLIFHLIGAACVIGSIVCYILVLIQMFERGQTGLASPALP